MELTLEQRRLIEDFYKYLSNKKAIDKLYRGYHPRNEFVQLFADKLKFTGQWNERTKQEENA